MKTLNDKPSYALVLWGGQNIGQNPRTALFEINYSIRGRLIGRKVGAKNWKTIKREEMLHNWNDCPTAAQLRKVKKTLWN